MCDSKDEFQFVFYFINYANNNTLIESINFAWCTPKPFLCLCVVSYFFGRQAKDCRRASYADLE